MIFRDKLERKEGISLSGDCCIVCGWNEKNINGNILVIGAHVRPFESVSDYDKRDNIIGLCPNHHIEYDVGNITIDPVRFLCIHRDHKNPFHLKKIIGKINHIQKGYFDYHRKNIFNKKKK